MAKLEMKIRELEAELATTQSRSGEGAKAFQRAERVLREKTERTKIECPSWLASRSRSRHISSRSRRQRKLQPSTWSSSEL